MKSDMTHWRRDYEQIASRKMTTEQRYLPPHKPRVHMPLLFLASLNKHSHSERSLTDQAPTNAETRNATSPPPSSARPS